MDILKQEIFKKATKPGQRRRGRKVFKHSDIEQKLIQRLREDEKREQETKAQSQTQQQGQDNQKDDQSLSLSSNPNSKSEIPKSKHESSASSSSKALSDEQKIDALNLPKQEVIRRLRFLKQPVFSFSLPIKTFSLATFHGQMPESLFYLNSQPAEKPVKEKKTKVPKEKKP